MAIFPIFFLLLLFAGVAVAAVIVLAIANNRAGLAILVGGGAVVLVLALLILGFVGFAMQPHDVSVKIPAPYRDYSAVNDAARAAAQGLQEFQVSSGEYSGQSSFNWGGGISILLLTCIALVIFLIVVIGRWLMSPAAACGHRRLWPVLLAIPLVAVLLLSTMRVRMATNRVATIEAAPQIVQEMSARQQAMIARQNTSPASPEESAGLADHFAAMADRQYQGVIPPYGQMDQFDQPRIALPPKPATPDLPEAPAEATATPIAEQPAAAGPGDSKEKAASAADKAESKSKTSDAAKPPAAPKQKRKKPAMPPAGVESKTTHVIAQSKAGERDKNSATESAKPEKSATFRPAWVDESPRLTGSHPREVISTDEYATVDECYQAADIYLLFKTYQYIQQFAGRPNVDPVRPSISFHSNMILANGNVISYRTGNRSWTDPRLQELSNMGIGTDYVRRKVVAKDPSDGEPREYVETTDHSSVGPMKKLYLQVEFTPAVEAELHQRWDARERQERFAMVGVGAGSVLGLLSLVFALLKIDTVTKGYYTKRLFLGVPAVIIGGFLLIMLIDMKR